MNPPAIKLVALGIRTLVISGDAVLIGVSGTSCSLLFDDFEASNGATKYVPRSHLFRDRPEREADYEYEYMVGSAGDLLIFDCGMWHRAGEPSDKDRWGLFSFYGPWFMKPYFAFPEMLGSERGKVLSKRLRHLLHYTSIPPVNDEERSNTLVRE